MRATNVARSLRSPFPSNARFRERVQNTRYEFSLSRRSNVAWKGGVGGGEGKISEREREERMERSGDKKEQFEEEEEKARALIGFE